MPKQLTKLRINLNNNRLSRLFAKQLESRKSRKEVAVLQTNLINRTNENC